MAEVKWSEFPEDLAATPENSEIVLLKDGENKRAPGVNWKGDKGDQGDPGADGSDGSNGTNGTNGTNATATAGTTTTTAPGTNADVTNVGTINNAVFDFDIPRGDVGATGAQGDPGNDGNDGAAATCDAGNTTTLAPGSNATVVNVGTTAAAVFDFGIPEGVKGDQGDPGTGYILQGSATVATLNALDANLIGDSFAWVMLDSGTVQPVNGVGSVEVVTDDLVVWAAPSLIFVNYGNQSGGGGGDVVGPAVSVNDDIPLFDGVTGKLLKDSGLKTTAFATATQGALADTAVQPGDNVSTLTNDAGYSTVDALDDLSDVALTAPADKEGLTFNGTNWVNGFPYESGGALPAPAGYPEGFLFLVTT